MEFANLFSFLFQHGFTAHPSACTAKHVKAYFVDGVMPKPGTQCEVDSPPFEVGMEPEDEEGEEGEEEESEDSEETEDSEESEDGSENTKKRGISLSNEDAKLHKAMLKLNRIAKRHTQL